MSTNIYDTINQLEKDVYETSQYQELQSAYEKMTNDEEAVKIWKEFQEVQKLIQEKQQTAEQLTAEEAETIQRISEKMTNNEITSRFINAERALHQVYIDVNRALEKPIQKFYQ